MWNAETFEYDEISNTMHKSGMSCTASGVYLYTQGITAEPDEMAGTYSLHPLILMIG